MESLKSSSFALLCTFVMVLNFFIVSSKDAKAATSSFTASDQERYAALECQNEQIFIIVNFYYGRIYKLSWGSDDKVVVADQIVHRSMIDNLEIFENADFELSLPEAFGRDSIQLRIGNFKIRKTGQREWNHLRCLLHGAD